MSENAGRGRVGDLLKIESIPDRVAREFYIKNHSYMPYLNRVVILNHGGFIDGELVAAVTYTMLRASHEIWGRPSDEYVEVARTCVGADIPNLASCMMARSQDRFLEEWAKPHGVSLLVTFVAEGYDGTMYRALTDKGWQPDGVADTRPSGNRENREIQGTEKTRWVCELDYESPEQATLPEVVGP